MGMSIWATIKVYDTLLLSDHIKTEIKFSVLNFNICSERINITSDNKIIDCKATDKLVYTFMFENQSKLSCVHLWFRLDSVEG